jgi:exonuclease SbcC
MIKSIHLQNFMSHSDSHIVLDNRLNVIIGKNDVGKSAVLHALRWFLINEPRGTNFITTGEKLTRVSIEVEDATLVKERTATTTKFVLESFGEAVETYYKTEIPEEFLELLEINVVTKFGNFSAELNFIFQHDSYFMISDSGSSGAQVLGKIAGTDPVDYASKQLKKESFGLNNILKTRLKELEELEEKLSEYNYLELLKEQYTGIKSMVDDLKKKVNRVKALRVISNQHSLCLYEIKKLKELYSQYENIDEQNNTLQAVASNYSKLSSIRGLYTMFEGFTQKIKSTSLDLMPLTRLDDVESVLFAAEIRGKRRRHLHMCFDNLVDTNKLITNAKTEYAKCNNIEGLEDKIAAVSTSLKNMKGYQVLYLKNLESAEGKSKIEKQLDSYDIDIDDLVEEAHRNITKREILFNLKHMYKSVTSSVTIAKEMLNEAEVVIEKEQENINNLFEQLDVCPLCEQKISH